MPLIDAQLVNLDDGRDASDSSSSGDNRSTCDYASSVGSDDEESDIGPDEYIRKVGVVAMIDNAYATAQDAQPYASELVDVLARALEEWRLPDGGVQPDQQSASSDITALLGSPTTPSDIMAGLDPEALFVLGVERALVEGVQELVAERPFFDEAPHFLANQLRIRTAHLGVPPEALDEEATDSHHISLEPEPEQEPKQPGTDPLVAWRCACFDLRNTTL